MRRLARPIVVAPSLATLGLVTSSVSTAKALFQFFVCSRSARLPDN
jgi:hypothetical protein